MPQNRDDIAQILAQNVTRGTSNYIAATVIADLIQRCAAPDPQPRAVFYDAMRIGVIDFDSLMEAGKSGLSISTVLSGVAVMGRPRLSLNFSGSVEPPPTFRYDIRQKMGKIAQESNWSIIGEFESSLSAEQADSYMTRINLALRLIRAVLA